MSTSYTACFSPKIMLEYNKFEISPFSFKTPNLKIENFLAYFINDFFLFHLFGPNSLESHQ